MNTLLCRREIEPVFVDVEPEVIVTRDVCFVILSLAVSNCHNRSYLGPGSVTLDDRSCRIGRPAVSFCLLQWGNSVHPHHPVTAKSVRQYAKLGRRQQFG